jgi:hypothetical protein
MLEDQSTRRIYINYKTVHENFPTHMHAPDFWETLGRVVATFGFLEEVLGRAIYAFTVTPSCPEEQLEAAYEVWLPTLQRALTDALGGLINSYESAVRDNSESTMSNFDVLIADLRKASSVRNVICHGSWRLPDSQGRSIPLFVNRKNELFETPIDLPFLRQTRQHVVELAIDVMNTVTQMGWQFPGSGGPGIPILSFK